MFATSAELDDGALAELHEFTAAFERRLADAPPTESVPPSDGLEPSTPSLPWRLCSAAM